MTFALSSSEFLYFLFLLLPPPPGVEINKGLVSDWVKQQRVRKWRWAGHVLRRKDGRWARRMLHWVPHGGERRRGRPATRWEDALEASAQEHGQKWETWAEDNNAWRTGEVGFAKKAKVRGGGDPKSVFSRSRPLIPHDPTGSGFSDVGALALVSYADL